VLLDRGLDSFSEPELGGSRRIGVDSDECVSRLRHRRSFRFVGGSIDLVRHLLVDRCDLFRGHPFTGEHFDITVEGIVCRRPSVDLAFRHVRLIVVLRVSLPPISDQLDERHPAAGARAIDGALGDFVRRQYVVAVGGVSVHSVADRLVDEILRGGLLGERSRVRVSVVLDDHHQRAPLHGGEIDSLVKSSRRSGAVADVNHSHPRLFSHLERERHAGHHRDHVAEVRDLADESADEIAVMDVELASARGRVTLCHVLLDDLVRLRALNQHRAEVPDQRGEDVAFGAVEGVRAADGVRLLAEGAEQSADDLCLAVEIDETLLEGARQSHIVVELEAVLPRQSRGSGGFAARFGRGARRSGGPRHPSTLLLCGVPALRRDEARRKISWHYGRVCSRPSGR
jgi:hypothetical protein